MINESMRRTGLVALALLAVVLSAFAPSCLLSEDADADEAGSTETYYRYTVNFYNTSTDFKYIFWNFGDGEVLDGRYEYYVDIENNGGSVPDQVRAGLDAYKETLAKNGGNICCPVHTYGSMGSYTVTLLAYNPLHYTGATDAYNGGLYPESSDTTVCGSVSNPYSSLIVIMGYPVITFNTNGGSSIANLTVENSSEYVAAKRPADPVKPDCTFYGWFTDSKCSTAYDWSSPVTSDITLYALWSDEATFAYTDVIWGPTGAQVHGQHSVSASADTLSGITPFMTGYTFSGWYSDVGLSSVLSPETKLAADLVAYAKFTINTYLVLYTNIDGTQLQSTTVEYGSPTPAYTGATPHWSTSQYSYSFLRWSPIPADTVTQSVTYVALYGAGVVNTYTVTYVNTDGTQLQSTTVEYGSPTPAYTGATPAQAPNEAYHYEFINTWVPAVSATVTGNAVYTAQFMELDNIYTVTFVCADGKVLGTESITYGSTAHKIVNNDYTYEYFSDAEMTTAYDFSTMVHSDSTVYVKETPVEHTSIIAYVVLVVGVVILLVGLAYRQPVVVVAGLAAAVLGLLLVLGVLRI